MAAKELMTQVKLQVPAGSANPAPPVGPALGQHGLNIQDFCKQFNDKTKDAEKGMALPVVINVYKDRSFDFVIKSAPAAALLKKAAGIQKGSATPHTNKVAKVTKDQLADIVKAKEGDLIVFDYTATVDDKPFKGNEGKNTQLTLGKDLFLKGFDKQLYGVKKDDEKIVESVLPENFPEKDLINKKAKFKCKILNIKNPEEVKQSTRFIETRNKFIGFYNSYIELNMLFKEIKIGEDFIKELLDEMLELVIFRAENIKTIKNENVKEISLLKDLDQTKTETINVDMLNF